MRLDNDCNSTRPCIVAQFVQARGDSRLRLLVREPAGIALFLPPKDANVGCAKTCGQIDEPLRISQFFCPFALVRKIQIRRTAYTSDLQMPFANLTLGLPDSTSCKNGMRWQIEIAFQTAQLDGTEPMLMSELQDFCPIPRGTAQS